MGKMGIVGRSTTSDLRERGLALSGGSARLQRPEEIGGLLGQEATVVRALDEVDAAV